MSTCLLEMSPVLGPPLAPILQLPSLCLSSHQRAQGASVCDGWDQSLRTLMRWISIAYRSSAPINPASGRQLVVNKHSVTGGMRYWLWLIKVCTEVEELIPQQIMPLLLLLGFEIFFSIRHPALSALLKSSRNQWLEPRAFGGLKRHVRSGESRLEGFQQAGMSWGCPGQGKDPGGGVQRETWTFGLGRLLHWGSRSWPHLF